MTQKSRQFGSGQTGGVSSLNATDLNSMVEGVEKTKRELQQVRAKPKTFAFQDAILVACTGTIAAPGWPTDVRIQWTLHHIDAMTSHGAPSFPQSPNAQWSSDPLGTEDPYAVPAFPIVPPYGMVLPMRDLFGDARPVYQPPTMAYAVTLSGFDVGAGTYTVTAADGSFEYDDIVPVDRINGVDYDSPGSERGVMVIYDDETRELWANEQPRTVTCPPKFAGPKNTGPQSTPESVESFLNL